MLRLLIVDDEKNTREGLEECVNWEALDVTIIGKACNGLEALEAVETCKPDLVITDVCMPKMDGIELAKRIREKDENIRVIFISGYTDLDYLKSAYKCDAVDYLLKPVDIEELEQAVRTVVISYKKQKKEASDRQDMEQRLRESMPFLRDKFLHRLISEEIEEQSEIEEQLHFLNISLPIHSCYCAIIVGIEETTKAFNMQSQKDRQLLSFSIQNVVQEVIERHTQGFIVEWTVKEYVCALMLPEEEKEAQRLLEQICLEIHNSLNQYMSLRNSIGVGRKEYGLYGLHRSFRFAKNALSRRMILGSNVIIYAGDSAVETEEVFLLPQIFYERLVSAILNGDADHVQNLLQEAFEILRETKREDEIYFRNGCLLIASYIVSASGRIEISERKIAEKLSQLHQNVLQLNTLNAIQELFIETTTDVCHHIAERKRTKKEDVVDEVKAIIQKRYRDKLSIEEIAKSVYLSPTYICLLFKQETGQTINGYLTEIRMEAAKKLLLSGEHKVLDVAISVGYQDQKYFCKLFKKYTGVNPSEYR